MCVANRVPGYWSSNRCLNPISRRSLSVYHAPSNSSGRCVTDGATTEAMLRMFASNNCWPSSSSCGLSASTKYTPGFEAPGLRDHRSEVGDRIRVFLGVGDREADACHFGLDRLDVTMDARI